MEDRSIISFAYLYKKLSFKTKFERRSSPEFAFNGKKVPSFWAQNEEQKQQIRVAFYHNQDDFCISIPDRETKDVIHLIKKKPVKTVDEALLIVKNINSFSQLTDTDQFEMPIIDLDC